MTPATARLLLRPVRDDDRDEWAAMNADPEVRRFFPSLLTRAAADAELDRIAAATAADGVAPWAVERVSDHAFLGVTGLSRPRFEAPFTPAVEVGWRLRREAWGHGYATEAARVAVAAGFAEHGLTEIVSFTATANTPSRAVMRRLGMRHDPADDFDHPALPEGHPLRRHVLYRLAAPDRRPAV